MFHFTIRDVPWLTRAEFSASKILAKLPISQEF